MTYTNYSKHIPGNQDNLQYHFLPHHLLPEIKAEIFTAPSASTHTHTHGRVYNGWHTSVPPPLLCLPHSLSLRWGLCLPELL